MSSPASVTDGLNRVLMGQIGVKRGQTASERGQTRV